MATLWGSEAHKKEHVMVFQHCSHVQEFDLYSVTVILYNQQPTKGHGYSLPVNHKTSEKKQKQTKTDRSQFIHLKNVSL